MYLGAAQIGFCNQIEDSHGYSLAPFRQDFAWSKSNWSVRSAVRSQVALEARSSPSRRRLSRKSLLETTRRIPSAMDSTSSGSTSTAASATTSGREVPLDVT